MFILGAFLRYPNRPITCDIFKDKDEKKNVSGKSIDIIRLSHWFKRLDLFFMLARLRAK